MAVNLLKILLISPLRIFKFIGLVAIIILSQFGASFSQKALPSFEPKKGDHIIILGNTFADRMRHYGNFETLLQNNYPKHQLTVRNLGWSADEVGLQPRPLNFPGFRREIVKQIDDPKDLSFRSWGGVTTKMPVTVNFEGLHQSLQEEHADVIFLCFGLNEAFKGPKGLPQFEKDLTIFIDALQSKKYNGKSTPTLVLVSPIAHEKMGGYLPSPDTHNSNLAQYSETMRKVSIQKGLSFIDLFAPTKALMQEKPQNKLTINGIHLNDKGYAETAKMMGQQLGFNSSVLGIDLNSTASKQLREVVKMKDAHFFFRWRAVNGEYIYGRRREPFGIISFPPELAKLDQMTMALDSVIWNMAQGKDVYKKARKIVDESANPAAQEAFLVTKMTGKQSRPMASGHHDHGNTAKPAGIEQFTVPDGYQVNLFASEENFPLAKPVAMSFDTRGRLWVATMPTYPQYIPGVPVHDKIVILEDTNGDGKADKHTVFADNLYLPLGFEFGNGGVYVSQEPDLVFLKDTDGDDVADVREVILSGFGSEDSHHATHAFAFGQDGGLYFNEGTFLNTQVETPFGPIRSYEGATYRFEPRTGKLEHYISYPYYNPWGNIFDKWGTHLIGDASDGSNYFAPPMTGKVDYPVKHPRINMFTTTRVRPTAGLEIVSSRHFPNEVQGNLLINNAIGFQGIKQHQVLPDKSALTSKEVEPLLQSSDPNFRPVDLEFGPDGALYVVDWYNPLISHGENPPRDPARDKTHGRIWRITHKGSPLLRNIDISKKSTLKLLDNLKEHEDRLRYRTRIALREMDPKKVLPELDSWVKKLKPSDTNYEHHLLEALWLYQDFQSPKPALLNTLLKAKDFRARAAATRIVRYWKESLPDAVALLAKSIQDPEPRVRIEAIAALSYFESEEAVKAATEILKQPSDYYLDYAIQETFLHLKPVWFASFKKDPTFLAKDPKAAGFLLATLNPEELNTLPQTQPVLLAQIDHPKITVYAKDKALKELASQTKQSPVDIIVQSVKKREEQKKDIQDLLTLLLIKESKNLATETVPLKKLLNNNESILLQSLGYAGLIAADGNDKNVWSTAVQTPSSLTSYVKGIGMLQNLPVQAQFYEKVQNLTKALPDNFPRNLPDSTVIPIHSAAYETLFKIPGHEIESTNTLAQLIKPEGPYLSVAQNVMEKMEDSDLRGKLAQFLSSQILSYANETPEDKRFDPSYNRTLKIGKRMAGLIPTTNGQQVLQMLEGLSTAEVSISAIPAQMLFDQKILTFPAGKRVSLTFNNPDLMPHNIVFTKPGAEEKIGTAADAMAASPGAFEKNFIPDSPDILFASPLVNPGQNYRLNFIVPNTPGDYPFICSFPGHWRVMRGIMKVTASN